MPISVREAQYSPFHHYQRMFKMRKRGSDMSSVRIMFDGKTVIDVPI